MICRMALAAALLSASLFAHAAEDAKAAPAVDVTKGQAIAASVCVGCHGADGNSPAPVNPILAGQIKEYLYKQLTNFKAAEGKPAVRANPIDRKSVV